MALFWNPVTPPQCKLAEKGGQRRPVGKRSDREAVDHYTALDSWASG